MLTSAGIEAPSEKPELSATQKKLLVQTWRGPINALMERLAGKNPELAAALLITLIVYGPVSYRALQYRKEQKAPLPLLQQEPLLPPRLVVPLLRQHNRWQRR